MGDDNKQDFKKNFSNSFVWFLMAAFLLALMVQNLIDTRFAKVSFSYQLEHLVNLQLLQPEDSRKIALNDNLATFSGKFRDRLTEDGKNRYKYLDLLNSNHVLTAEKERIEKDVTALQAKVVSSSEMYLLLTGQQIPSNGFSVVNDASSNGTYSVVIKTLPQKNIESLASLKNKFNEIKQNPTSENITAFGQDLSHLVTNFRSPVLGIGNEAIKTSLKNIEAEVASANELPKTALEPIAASYQAILNNLSQVSTDLGTEENGLNLAKLRSVRNYKEAVDEIDQLTTKIEDNQVQLDKARLAVANVIWYFNNQELSTRTLEKEDHEKFNQWFINAKEEFENFNQNKGGVFKAPDQPLNKVLEKTFKSEEPATNYLSYLFTFLPALLVLGVLYFIFARQMKGVGNNAMSFGKSPAKLSIPNGPNKVTFKDVAGADEAIEELQEIVEFLKNPQKFTSLGGRIPKGVLCIGPPGTGKTLIAKAVAGEADRPFFSISGSDFVEMFVGVGASRIRDMFEQAKKNAPCIIFMDEIDAVGRHRGAGMGGGHDEREQTLNQLLVEMDGFDTNEGVILMAATNRPDVLDKALLRPGRFDRRVIIGLPDIKGRFDILKVHARRIKLDPTVDLMSIARSTPGSSGADLANLLNEAALLAARRGRLAVTSQEVSEARDKVLYGKERRSLEIDDAEKRTTAFHEAGHTIVSMFVDHADPIDKVTIIPRGLSLGATMFLPKKNRVSYWKKELIDQLAVLMGGRVAEEIFVSDISSGARQDIEQATSIARSMVCEWGMTDKLGPVAYAEGTSSQYGASSEKKYSEVTAREIDAEVREILDQAHDRALEIVKDKAKEVQLITDMLMEFETLDFKDIEDIAKGDWDIEAKKIRLKKANELHKKPADAIVIAPHDPDSDSKGLTLNPSSI
jgi:cell division protease FtsH